MNIDIGEHFKISKGFLTVPFVTMAIRSRTPVTMEIWGTLDYFVLKEVF